MALQTNLTTLKKPGTQVEIVEQWLDQHPEKRAEVLNGRLLDRAFFGTLNHDRARNNQRKAIERDKR